MSAVEDRLAEIEALANAATPGPWFDGMGTRGNPGDGPDFVDVYAIAANGASNRIAELQLDADGGADAAFIAATRTDVPALTPALRAARQVITYAIEDADRAYHDTTRTNEGRAKSAIVRAVLWTVRDDMDTAIATALGVTP